MSSHGRRAGRGRRKLARNPQRWRWHSTGESAADRPKSVADIIARHAEHLEVHHFHLSAGLASAPDVPLSLRPGSPSWQMRKS